MKEFTYKITCEGGLHARPAGMLVKTAQACTSSVKISKSGKKADAKKLFALMSLGAKQNDEIVVEVEGQNEEIDCENVKSLLESL